MFQQLKYFTNFQESEETRQKHQLLSIYYVHFVVYCDNEVKVLPVWLCCVTWEKPCRSFLCEQSMYLVRVDPRPSVWLAAAICPESRKRDFLSVWQHRGLSQFHKWPNILFLFRGQLFCQCVAPLVSLGPYIHLPGFNYLNSADITTNTTMILHADSADALGSSGVGPIERAGPCLSSDWLLRNRPMCDQRSTRIELKSAICNICPQKQQTHLWS